MAFSRQSERPLKPDIPVAVDLTSRESKLPRKVRLTAQQCRARASPCFAISAIASTSCGKGRRSMRAPARASFAIAASKLEMTAAWQPARTTVSGTRIRRPSTLMRRASGVRMPRRAASTSMQWHQRVLCRVGRASLVSGGGAGGSSIWAAQRARSRAPERPRFAKPTLPRISAVGLLYARVQT